MTLDSVVLWLETYAFRGFVMVALASSLIGLFGLLLSLAFRRRSAAVRFSIWQMVACGVVLSTALILFIDGVAVGPVQNPSSTGFALEQPLAMYPLPFTREHSISEDEATQFASDALASNARSQANSESPREFDESIRSVSASENSQPPEPVPAALPEISWAALVGMTWMVFALLMSFGVAKSTVHAWAIVRRASLTEAERFSACLKVAMRRVGLNPNFRVRLVQTDQMSVPFTVGFMRPTVVIPKDANDWSTEKLTMVLAHELAHVKRRDVFWQWVSRLACCFTGFNPLTLLAARRCAIEREHACDDCVIGAGFDAADYGETLLEIASSMSGRRVPIIGISMAQPALRQRLETVLAVETDRRPVTRRTLTVLLVVFGLLAVATGVIRPLERRVLADQVTTPQSVAAQPPAGKPELATIKDEGDDDTNDEIFVTGTVSDLDARPIANATVELHQREFTDVGPHYSEIYVRSWTTVTDEQGNYRVNVGSPSDFSDKARIGIAFAVADGFAREGGRDWKKLAEIRKGKSISPIKLQAGHLVRGRLLDSSGTPIKGMIKGAGTGGEINDMWWINVGHKVGDDGQIIVSVPDDYQIELMAYAARHAAQRIVLTKGDAEIGDVKLSKGTIVRGVLIDKDSKPVPSVVIAMKGTGGQLNGISFEEQYAVVTSQEGVFKFPRSSGKFSVRATYQDHASNFMSQTTVAGNPPPAVLPVGVSLADEGKPIELTLQEAESVTISGMAHWENGEPAANLEVRCSGWRKTDGRSVGGEFTRMRTDAEGRYALTVPASLDELVLSAVGTRNSEGVWLPAHGECDDATVDGSQGMEFKSLTKNVTTANWVLKPWPAREKESKLQRKVQKEFEAIVAKERTLFEQYVEARKSGDADFDPDYSLDPRKSMAYEYLAFEREYRGEEVAFRALKVVMETASRLYDPEGGARARQEAVDRIISHYIERKDLADAFPFLGDETMVPRGTRLLTKAVQESPHPEVRAVALTAKIVRVREMRRIKSMLPDLEKLAANLLEREQHGIFTKPSMNSASVQRRIAQLKDTDSEALKKDANLWLDLLIRDYGNIPNPKTKSKLSFGETAELLRTSITDIEIGKPVPEIKTTDVHGKPFRLSELRGKVVILTFAYSSPHSVGVLVPRDTRRVQEKYADKGVELVSIISVVDDKTAELVAAVKSDHPDGTFIAEPQRYGPLRWQWGGDGGEFVINRDGVLVHCGETLFPLEEVVKRALNPNLGL